MLKILIIRTDHIGDLILSIPVIRAIKYNYKDSKIGLLISERNAALLPFIEDVDYKYSLKKDFSNFTDLTDEIKEQDFSHSVTLFVDNRASWIPLRTGIPFRTGPLSKFSSFVKFNRGSLQRRSRSIKNEAEYNLELLKKINIDYENIPVEHLRPSLKIPPEDETKFIDAFPYFQEKFVVIHPGMGGSALNAAKETYLKIAHDLSGKIKVYLTFGPDDSELFKFFSEHFNPEYLIRNLSLSDLAILYSHSSAFIGPSTGPMHIAAATGKKVFAIFSPVKVQSHFRWGPWGSDSMIFSPEVKCRAKYKCDNNCTFFNCVINLSPDKLISEVLGYIDKL